MKNRYAWKRFFISMIGLLCTMNLISCPVCVDRVWSNPKPFFDYHKKNLSMLRQKSNLTQDEKKDAKD